MLHSLITTFVSELAIDRNVTNRVSKSLKSWSLIVDAIPEEIRLKSSLSSDYLIVGSIGKGLMSETPWIGLFDTEVTKSAQTGYYVVYLFTSDLKGVYLSLGIGWTQYENAYGIKTGKIRIKENAKKARVVLRGILDYSTREIDLKASGQLTKGYEQGNICSKYYSIDSLPEDSVLIDDLRNFIGLYKELKGLVGKDILQIDSVASEDEYQEAIQKSSPPDLPQGPIPRSSQILQGASAARWSRKPAVARVSLDLASYKCEFEFSHETFISDVSGVPFMEAHHLVPMSYQGEFQHSLDVPENIVSLCPNCHRAIHHASLNIRNEIIDRLFNLRRDKLVERGILIDIATLLKCYRADQ